MLSKDERIIKRSWTSEWSTQKLNGYSRGHQPFWNCELLLVHRLMRRATSFMHTFEIKILLNLPLIIWVLIMLMIFLEPARGRPTWSLRATWCPRAPRWWPPGYRLLFFMLDYGCCFYCLFATFLILCSSQFSCFLYICIYGFGIFR